MKSLIIASVLVVAMAMMAAAAPNPDRPIRRSADFNRIQELLKEMAEAKEEEAPSQEMCIDQNDEVECTCIRFKGKKHPVCVGSNCSAEPAGIQERCSPGNPSCHPPNPTWPK
ncbi:uncharacterized protein LOC135346365 isoform X2 [Halichondria panicea]|uniref:uncharacterized protein LOC135346365 isoform X2 n=1 Tax=Halichondria panicea TaxID=6063 RepID=UPI00312B7441